MLDYQRVTKPPVAPSRQKTELWKRLQIAIVQQTRNSRDAYQMRMRQNVTSETLKTPGRYLAQRKFRGPAASSK